MWLLIEDQATSMKRSHVIRRKGKLVDKIMHFIKSLKTQDPNKARFVRLDNAGDNLGLRTHLE
jgi:hypothetical protein